jgi:hypothetical protein
LRLFLFVLFLRKSIAVDSPNSWIRLKKSYGLTEWIVYPDSNRINDALVGYEALTLVHNYDPIAVVRDRG